MAKNKKTQEEREYEELMKELQDAQDDKFLLDPDFDEMGYAYGGKVMKKKYGGKMRGYGKAYNSRPERTVQMPNPYSTTLYDTPQKDTSYKPTKAVSVRAKPITKMGKKSRRRP